VIFAYDEAQNLSDHPGKEQFQSIQSKGISFMLVLAGLPTLFPKLVDARTYAERMFRVVTLTRLSDDQSREAMSPSRSSSRWRRYSASWTSISLPAAGQESPTVSENSSGWSPIWTGPMMNSRFRN
jgi:hypothetical protein